MEVLTPKGSVLGYVLCATAAILFLGVLWAPLLEGCASFFCRLVRHGRVGAAELLSFYVDKKRYGYALARYFCRMLRILFFFGAFFAFARLGKGVATYLTAMGAVARGALVLGGTLFFLAVLLILFVRFSYRTYLMEAARFCVPCLSFRAAGAISASGMRHRYGRVLLLDLSFLPLFVFSFLLLGFPLLFVLPHYLAARAEMAFALLSAERQ